MIVVIIEEKNSIYTRSIRTFKRKNIHYYLFILYNKIIKRKYEVLDNG